MRHRGKSHRISKCSIMAVWVSFSAAPVGLKFFWMCNPQLKLRALFNYASGAGTKAEFDFAILPKTSFVLPRR